MIPGFVRLVDRLNGWVGTFTSLLLVPLLLVTGYEVFMRFVVGRPTLWAWGLNIHLCAAIVMLGGAEALRRGAHAVMDVWVSRLHPRNRALLDLLTAPVFFCGIALMLVGGWHGFVASWDVGDAVPTIWAPIFRTMKFLVPSGAFLLILQGLAEFCRNLEVISRGGEDA